MNKKLIATSFLSLGILLVLGTSVVYAQAQPVKTSNPDQTVRTKNEIPVKFENPFRGGETSLFGLLRKIINEILMPLGGAVAVLAFIYSGFLYVKAQGNTTKIGEAHQALLFTSIGTAVLLGAWVLANVICQTISELGGPACAI